MTEVTIMYMLVGVLVEVMTVISATEKEGMTVSADCSEPDLLSLVLAARRKFQVHCGKPLLGWDSGLMWPQLYDSSCSSSITARPPGQHQAFDGMCRKIRGCLAFPALPCDGYGVLGYRIYDHLCPRKVFPKQSFRQHMSC